MNNPPLHQREQTGDDHDAHVHVGEDRLTSSQSGQEEDIDQYEPDDESRDALSGTDASNELRDRPHDESCRLFGAGSEIAGVDATENGPHQTAELRQLGSKPTPWWIPPRLIRVAGLFHVAGVSQTVRRRAQRCSLV